jgi:hypothetical protein
VPVIERVNGWTSWFGQALKDGLTYLYLVGCVLFRSLVSFLGILGLAGPQERRKHPMRMLTVLVYMNTDKLGKRSNNLEARSDLLLEGIGRLRRETPYAIPLAPNPTSCAVSVQVGENRVDDFVDYLNANREWASYEFDGLGVFRAARK